MDVRTDLSKRRCGIRMWSILSGKDRNMAICAVYVFLYMANPKKWDESVKSPH
jgi:hypothetical protein